MSNRARVAILISGRGSNMQALVNASAEQRLDADIGLIISDNPAAGGLVWAAERGLATAVVERRQYPSKAAFEQAITERIEQAACTWLALAGFMRLLSAAFVQRYQQRLVNIHPSRLPAFKGLNTHQRALDAAVALHGASVHMVTAELDGGPVLIQSKVTLDPDDTAETLAAQVLQTEHQIYPLALQWLLSGRATYVDGQLFLDGQPLQQPVQWP